MKIIKEYLDFKTFKAKCDENILPLVEEKVKKYFSQEIIQDLKKWKTVFIASFILSAVLFIGAITSYITTFYTINQETHLIQYIFNAAILIAGLSFLIIALVFSFRYFKLKKKVSTQITADLSNLGTIYQVAFKNISPEFEYVNENDEEFQRKLLENEFPQVTEQDLENVTPICETPPILISIRKLASWVLDNKYPVEYYYLKWKYEVSRRDRVEIHYVYRGLIKMYTHHLGDKAFSWTLNHVYSPKLLRKANNFIQLENKQFNQSFQIKCDDRNAIFRIFTPYAQELALQRARERENTLFPHFWLKSSKTQNSVIFDFPGVSSFMNIQSKIHLDVDKVISGYYKDILIDTYSFYYLMCFIQIPLYLD